MFKKIVFQLHWLLGISAGAVLALMGLTGALLAFEDEALHALNPVQTVVAARHDRGERIAPLPELAQQLGLGAGSGLSRLTIDPTGERLSRLRAQTADGRVDFYFDPYSGQRLAAPRGVALFQLIEDLHRHLAAGSRGKVITGACVVILLLLCLSGLYLRWPRRWWNGRTWAVVEWQRRGRGLLWSLHSVVGTWCLLLYLTIALTGLYWSYDGYRRGLTWLLGGPSAAVSDHGIRDGKRARPDLMRVQAALASLPGLQRGVLDIRLPTRGAQVTVRYRAPDAPHARA